MRLGEVCLSYSGDLKPFYLGYAHEALARGHGLAANAKDSTRHLKSAHEFAVEISKVARLLLQGRGGDELNTLETEG